MPRERTTYLSALGGGLGDIIVVLPIFQALLKKENVIAVMRTERQMGFEDLIPGLAGSIKESELLTKTLAPNERHLNLRKHRIQTDYFWGGPEFEREYPAFKINDILGVMCADFDIAADFTRLEPFEHSRLPDLQNAVVCIPGTTIDAKSWSTRNWVLLKQQLEKIGLSVYMLGQPERSIAVRELQEQNFRLLETPKLKTAVDILTSARAVVSVDTGLMHLAVQQGTPTVCLFQDPIYYRPFPHAIQLLSKHCAEVCVKNRMSAKPQDTVEFREFTWHTSEFKVCLVAEEERCINSISVEDVMACLKFAL